VKKNRHKIIVIQDLYNNNNTGKRYLEKPFQKERPRDKENYLVGGLEKGVTESGGPERKNKQAAQKN